MVQVEHSRHGIKINISYFGNQNEESYVVWLDGKGYTNIKHRFDSIQKALDWISTSIEVLESYRKNMLWLEHDKNHAD